MDSAKSQAVLIAVREAPFRSTSVHGKHLKEESVIKFSEEHPKVLIVDGNVYSFDNVFNSAVTQSELYDTLIQPLVLKVLDGYDCTALAYGQTGTGKSYSMGMSAEIMSEEHMGVLPRCLNDILEGISMTDPQKENYHEPKLAYASFIEIYNEKAYDLLAQDTTKPLASRGQRRFTGGTCQPLRNQQDLQKILLLGNKNRHVRPTNMNGSSSRSHAIVTIHIKQGFKKAHLNIIDLAGSEGVRRTGNEGMARAEGVYINMGLLGINKVMLSLAAGNTVIPYRDSILTTVLQDSLSAGSYLTLLACVSPHAADLSETNSTLRFAKSAKNVKLAPRLSQQLQQLQQKVRSARKKSSNAEWLRRMLPSSTVIKRTLDTRALRATSNSFCTPTKNTKVLQRHHSDIGLTPKGKECLRALKLLSVNSRRTVLESVPIEFSPVADQSDSSVEIVQTPPAAPNTSNCTTLSIKDDDQQQQEEQQLSQNDPKDAERKPSLSLLSYNNFNSELCSIEEENDENIVTSSVLLSSTCNLSGINIRAISPVRVSGISPLSISPSSIAKSKSKPRVCQRRSVRLMSRQMQIEAVQNKGQEQMQRCRNMRVALLPKSPANKLPDKVQQQMLRRRSMRIAMKAEILPRSPANKLPDNVCIKDPQKCKTNNKLSRLTENFICRLECDSQDARVRKHCENMLQLLNSASVKDLQALPCIGPKTAMMLGMQRMILGHFTNWQQVQKLPIWRGNSWDRFATANCIEII